MSEKAAQKKSDLRISGQDVRGTMTRLEVIRSCYVWRRLNFFFQVIKEKRTTIIDRKQTKANVMLVNLTG